MVMLAPCKFGRPPWRADPGAPAETGLVDRRRRRGLCRQTGRDGIGISGPSSGALTPRDVRTGYRVIPGATGERQR